MIRRVSLSSGEWVSNILLALIAAALVIICRRLKRENERSRRSNRELEGTVGRPHRATTSWLPRVAVASFLLPCIGSFALSPFLILARARDAAAQLRAATWMPGLGAGATMKVLSSGTQRLSTEDQLRSRGCEILRPAVLWGHLEEVAERERVATILLQAVIFRESSFHPCAVSSSGALGLMQLMPETAAELGVTDPFDPLENIEGGARFLGRLIVRYRGDLELALAAYHAGPTMVDAHGAVPPIPKTRTYVNDVMGLAGLKLEGD